MLRSIAVQSAIRGPAGATPRWLSALIKEGHSLEEFRIGAGLKAKLAAAKKSTMKKKGRKPAAKTRDAGGGGECRVRSGRRLSDTRHAPAHRNISLSMMLLSVPEQRRCRFDDADCRTVQTIDEHVRATFVLDFRDCELLDGIRSSVAPRSPGQMRHSEPSSSSMMYLFLCLLMRMQSALRSTTRSPAGA